MKRSIVPLGVAIATWLGQAPVSGAAPPFELVEGDRVVLIGGTLIERDQSFGHLETRLTRRYPDRSITFRNLGWSGDTVEGESRAGFGSVGDGFKHLVEHVLALKPTVIVVGYGANESFEGRAGLPKFVQGMETLLKAIEPTRARLVFLSPNRQENLGPPLPDPTLHNADLALYRDAIKAIAEKRQATFIDLFERLPDEARASPPKPLTNNGLHFTPYGSWRAAAEIEQALGVARSSWSAGAHVRGQRSGANYVGTVGTGLREVLGGFQVRLLDEVLPPPPVPGGGPNRPESFRIFQAPGLDPGRYTLKVDGKPVATATADEWKGGLKLEKGPEFDQVEALRLAINAKNQLYFYRWRPQNETYLFGFRKYEQGQNAREIPLFDPLVAAKEAEIARLKVPVPHLYELTREGEVGR